MGEPPAGRVVEPECLVDTDILVDAARGIPEASAFVARCEARSGIRLSVVSAMELVLGCRDAAALNRVQQLLARTTVIALDESASTTALRLVEAYHLSHGLRIPDALIAATAITRGLRLCTRNVRHFSVLPGIDLWRPW